LCQLLGQQDREELFLMAHIQAPKIRSVTVKVKGNDYERWLLDFGTTNGQRKRRSFKTRKAAERALAEWQQKQTVEAEKQKVLSRRIGEKAYKLTTDQLLDAAKAIELLAGRSALADAAQFYLQHTEPAGGTRTVRELLDEYLDAKKQAGRRADTLREGRSRLGRFSRDFGSQSVHQIAAHDLEKWLDLQGYRGQTRANFKRVFTGFWNYALKRKLVTYNPAAAIEKPSIDEKIPEIFTPQEAAQLLAAAQKNVPAMVPYFALGLLAGIRPAELQKLDWANIDLGARRVRVVPETAKKRRMRYVDISPNLHAWLLPYRQDSGVIYHDRHKFDLVRREAGVRWAHDIMRHSFGSYHLAHHDNAALTSLQMGHQGTSVLFNHYRDLVKREDAAKFWAIEPSTDPTAAAHKSPRGEAATA